MCWFLSQTTTGFKKKKQLLENFYREMVLMKCIVPKKNYKIKNFEKRELKTEKS